MTEISNDSKKMSEPAQANPVGWHTHVRRIAVITNILAVLVLLLSATLVFLYSKYS